MRVARFAANEHGRDFIVGDIHGHFTALSALLEGVNFEPEVDRLFSVGDLVDRGPESEQVLEWLAKPWFLPVRGNHEQMAIDCHAGEWSKENYICNGGSWFLGLASVEQAEIVAQLKELPLAIEIANPHEGGYGIVHAEPHGKSWGELLAALEGGDDDLAVKVLWGRARISSGNESSFPGIGQVFVGHTIVPRPARLGNVVYLDTGACAEQCLTLINLDDFRCSYVSTRYKTRVER